MWLFWHFILLIFGVCEKIFLPVLCISLIRLAIWIKLTLVFTLPCFSYVGDNILVDIGFFTWVGLSDVNKDNNFLALNGKQVTHTPWSNGEPDHFKSGNAQDCCVTISKKIRAEPCTYTKSHVLCQRVTRKFF